LLSKVYAAANWLHVETREKVIRRELLFEEGDCVDRLRLRETERLLRSYPFIEVARVEARRRPDGDADVTVFTQDAWSLVVEPRFEFSEGFVLPGIVVAERNLGGRGMDLELQYMNREGHPDFGVAYRAPQVLASRWDFSVLGIRSEPGWSASVSVNYPFLGLVGGWAGFQDAAYGERWFRYALEDGDDLPDLVLPMVERELQVGTAWRLRAASRGRSANLGSYGFTVSYQQVDYGSSFFEDAAGDSLGPEVDSLAAVPVGSEESLRLNLLVGYRGLEYMQRAGLQTLRAVEDLGIGASADLMLGLSVGGLAATSGQVLGALDLYGGSRVIGEWFSLVRANLEAQRTYDERAWGDVLARVQWTNYWRHSGRSVIELTARYAAGWEMTGPFQLTLGGPWGLAGYAPDRFPGGERVSVFVEHRHWAASLGKLVDLGTVLRVDAGQMWSNGALFGTDSGMRASVGAGILLALPAGSRQTYRLQVGAPIDSHVTWGDLVLSLRIERALALEADPLDLQFERSRDFALRNALRYLR
jgi:hypothetical protein